MKFDGSKNEKMLDGHDLIVLYHYALDVSRARKETKHDDLKKKPYSHLLSFFRVSLEFFTSIIVSFTLEF